MLSGLWAREKQHKRRRGRRKDQSDSEGEGPARISKTVGRQLLKWAQGTISASELHQICSDAESDEFVHPMVKRFARLRGEQWAHHDVMQLVGKSTPAFDMVSKLDEPESAATAVLLPSAVAKSLLRYYPLQFLERLGANQGALRKFWRSFRLQPRNTEFMRTSPHLKDLTMQQLTMTIPVTLHEDAGPISKGLSANSVSWCCEAQGSAAREALLVSGLHSNTDLHRSGEWMGG